jgi:phosphotransferase system  glucose/maltose/N-acetylglucosamine-specific IIC component
MQLGAVTLQQLNTVAGGFTVILAALVATTANLTAVYANGAAGVGATLTNSGVQVALTVDGVLTVVGNRILVKNQTTTFENGVYVVTVVGTGATDWVLTRATDYDQAPSQLMRQLLGLKLLRLQQWVRILYYFLNLLLHQVLFY